MCMDVCPVQVQTDLVVADIDGLVVNLTGENFRGRIQGVRNQTPIISSTTLSHSLQIAIGTLDDLEGFIGSFVNFTAVAVSPQ